MNAARVELERMADAHRQQARERRQQAASSCIPEQARRYLALAQEHDRMAAALLPSQLALAL